MALFIFWEYLAATATQQRFSIGFSTPDAFWHIAQYCTHHTSQNQLSQMGIINIYFTSLTLIDGCLFGML